MRPLLAACLLFACCPRPSARANDAAPTIDFDRQVAPLLANRCLDCHSGAEPKGGLDLARRGSALSGGDSGPPVVAGQPQASLLWQRVADGEMPPNKPLAAKQRRILSRWIAAGARWGSDPIDPFRFTTDNRAGYDWWALQPVRRPPLPEIEDAAGCRNPIDRFVRARLQAAGLKPAAPAKRRVWIRRFYFNLLGLPPTPAEVDAFANDPHPAAEQRLVDRLLASPDYGVRWGRHWLDIVRFGESQGFERDKLREHAWPYRDWVVDALNRDMPYDRFARWQLAADVLDADQPEALAATGFLVAGPYDEVGQNQQSAAMRAVVRQDELEDIVSAVGQTFLGLTVHCARCHDHKFDPIRQEEYYRLTAALAGVRHGERTVEKNPQLKKELQARAGDLQRQLEELEITARRRVLKRRNEEREANKGANKGAGDLPQPLAAWQFGESLADRVGTLDAEASGDAKSIDGAVHFGGEGYLASSPLTVDLRAKTLVASVRLDTLDQRGGGVMSVQTLDGQTFDAIVFGEKESGKWMAGSDLFRRTRPLDAPAEKDADRRFVQLAIAYHRDGTIAAYRDGVPYGKSYRSEGPVTFPAGKSQVVFGLRHAPPGGNKMLRGAVRGARLYGRALLPEQIASMAAARGEVVSRQETLVELTAAERNSHHRLTGQLAQVSAELQKLQPQRMYAVVPGEVGESHVLLRGNPAARGKAVTAGGVAAVRGVEADFGLDASSSDARRRRQLAAWIADGGNPLFARVIVNRLWHYHFGAGLVRTTSDFGYNGGRPSHPELLDWLAAELVAGNWSLKRIQRLIVTSATFRQSSAYDAAAAAVDADNRLLWRTSRRRLEAEPLRDAMLLLAGQLNRRMGGPGFRDFKTYVRNSQFYIPLDVDEPEHYRRTLYRTWVRSGRDRLLDAFDCPDPSTKTPRRAVTTTPLQALSLMNHVLVLRMADRFAERVKAEAGADPARQIDRVFQLAYGRGPDGEQRQAAAVLVEKHSLAALCRVIFNSNEFLYVD